MKEKNNEILLEILMRMKYDTRKTLSENLNLIQEQVSVSPVITPPKGPQMINNPVPQDPKFQVDPTIGCKYIEFAISPKNLPSPEYGVPIGYCAYNAPPQIKGGGNTLLLLPKPTTQQEWDGLKINFFSDKTDYVNIAKYWLKKYYKEKYGTDNPDTDEKYGSDFQLMLNKLIEYLPKALPKNTVRSFSLGNNQFVLHVQSDDKLGYPLDFTFYDYKSKTDGKSWFSIQPKLHDVRSSFGKFMDEYEGWLILGQIALLVASFFTGAGEFATILKIIDLIANTGLSLAIATRRYQKGENVDASVWVLFALLPYASYFKSLKIDVKVFDSLVEKIKSSSLGTKPSLQQLKDFYAGLTLKERETFTTIISDKKLLGEFKTLVESKNFPKVILSELTQNLERNPQLKKYLTTPAFWETLTGKEILVAMDALFLEYALNLIWGHKLNDESKKKLESVWWSISDNWKSEFIYNLGVNTNKSGEILSCFEENINDKRKKLDEKVTKSIANIILSHCYLKNGVAYFNFGGDEQVQKNKQILNSVGYIKDSVGISTKPVYDTLEYEGTKYVFPK